MADGGGWSTRPDVEDRTWFSALNPDGTPDGKWFFWLHRDTPTGREVQQVYGEPVWIETLVEEAERGYDPATITPIPVERHA